MSIDYSAIIETLISILTGVNLWLHRRNGTTLNRIDDNTQPLAVPTGEKKVAPKRKRANKGTAKAKVNK